MPTIAKRDFEDHYRLQMEFKLSTSLREEPVEEDFVHEISGRILVSYDDQEDWVEAGILHASLVQFNEAIEHGFDTTRMGDGISGEISEYWERLFDMNTGNLKPELQVDDETIGCNLLIIDLIEVYPKFRGHNVGLAAAQRVVDVFGAGCALVAATPYPLQFTPAFAADPDKLQKLQAPKCSEKEAVRKLQEYWSQAGFRRYGRSGVCLKSANSTADVRDNLGHEIV